MHFSRIFIFTEYLLQFDIYFNVLNYPLSIGIYLAPVSIGPEVNYNGTTRRSGKFTYTVTVSALTFLAVRLFVLKEK